MRKLTFTLLLLATTTTVCAYETGAQSSLKVNLGPEWKLSHTEEQPNIAKVSEYTNTLNIKKETLIATTLLKPEINPTPGPDQFAAKLYASTENLMKKNGCAYNNLTTIAPVSGKDNQWAMAWQCPQNNLTGFMAFINADAKTMYTITYKSAGSYPLTKAGQDQMTTILKSLQVCYNGKACAALIQ